MNETETTNTIDEEQIDEMGTTVAAMNILEEQQLGQQIRMKIIEGIISLKETRNIIIVTFSGGP